MKKLPNKHTASAIKHGNVTADYFGKGKWVPARPEPLSRSRIKNLITRLKLAWGVFTGKYDALDWEDYE